MCNEGRERIGSLQIKKGARKPLAMVSLLLKQIPSWCSDLRSNSVARDPELRQQDTKVHHIHTEVNEYISGSTVSKHEKQFLRSSYKT